MPIPLQIPNYSKLRKMALEIYLILENEKASEEECSILFSQMSEDFGLNLGAEESGYPFEN